MLPDGTRFEGPAGLRNVLSAQPDKFVRTLAEKMLIYALGRGVEYYDAPTIRQLVHSLEASGYRWSSLIVGIVQSAPFQMRRPAQPGGPATAGTVAAAR
jgi:hypothetical protein